MKRITLLYLGSYLLVGGLAFACVPDLAFRIFLSNGEYGDVMPRVAGMFMLALSGMIFLFVRYEDYKYYRYSVLARSFIVLFLLFLYYKTTDPLFLILNGIVLLGLIPSLYVILKEKQ